MDDMLKRIAECIGPKHGAKKELDVKITIPADFVEEGTTQARRNTVPPGRWEEGGRK